MGCGEPRCTPEPPKVTVVEGLPHEPKPPPPPEFTIEWDTTEELKGFLLALGVEPPRRFTVPDAAYFGRGRVLMLTDCMRITEKTIYVQYGPDLIVAWRERDLICLDSPSTDGNLTAKR